MLLSISSVNAFKTYTEKVNPFNKFMNPTEGVDLYSGTVAFTKTLYEMKGRNGLDIGINLKYSSNVYMSSRVSNEKAPTGWLGLGWNLSYGSIRRDHKGTVHNADDEYFWISPEGYEKKLFVSFTLAENGIPTVSPVCSIEDFPYIKVECFFEDNMPNRRITGWTLTKPDGTKLHYGDYNGTDAVRKTTRYTFAVGSDVQPQISQNSYGDITLYPYQWDLSDIEDNFGNHIVFAYQQDLETVRSFPWKDYSTSTPITAEIWETTAKYTKASYVKSITNSENERIEFDTIPKREDEYYDPHRFPIPRVDGTTPPAGAEPDAFIEIMDRQALGCIRVYNAKGNKIKEFEFSYKWINDPADNSSSNPFYGKHFFEKSLLTGIKEYNGGDHIESNILNEDVFEYYDDISKADEKSTQFYINYNYGALKRHKNRLGYVAEYDYESKMLDGTKTLFDDPLPIYLNRADFMHFSFGKITATGNPFCVFTYKESGTTEKCLTYIWDGSKWVKKDVATFTSGVDEMFCEDTSILTVAGNDYFALLGGPSRNCSGCSSPDYITDNRRLCAYEWNQKTEQWEMFPNLPGKEPNGLVKVISSPVQYGKYPFFTDNSSANVRMIGMPDYFVLERFCTNYHQNTYIEIFSRYQSSLGNIKWFKDILYDKDGNGYIKKMATLNTSGSPANWEPPFQSSHIQLTDKSIVLLAWNPTPLNKTELYAYNKIDHNWSDLPTVINDDVYGIDFGDYNIFSQKNWFAYSSGYDNGKYLKTYHWDGKSWIKTRTSTIHGEFQHLLDWLKPMHNSDFDIATSEIYPSVPYDTRWHLRRWNGYDWEDCLDITKYLFYSVRDPGYFKPIIGVNYSLFIDDRWGKHLPFFRICTWNNFDNKWEEKQFEKLYFLNSWKYGNLPNHLMGMHYDYFISYTSSFHGSVSTANPSYPWNQYLYGANVGMWDGLGWNFLSPEYTKSNTIVYPSDKILNTSSTNDAIAFIFNKDSPVLSLRYKFQNSFQDQIYTYVVTKKSMKPGFGQKEVVLEYEYPDKMRADDGRAIDGNGNFDTKTNSAKFNEVGVTLNNGSKVKNYYFNDRNIQSNENPDFDKLDGLIYKSKNFKNTDVAMAKPVAEQNTSYNVYIGSNWLNGVYEKRVVKNTTKLDGVKTEVQKNYTLNSNSLDINGQPRYVFTMNSDGRKITDYTLFAYEKYGSEFRGNNLLTQPCLQITLQDYNIQSSPSDNWYTSIPKANIRSATATTWQQFNGVWAPHNTYVWKVNKNGSGIPEYDFTGFDFTETSNPNWQFKQANTRYNQYGQVLEAEQPGGTAGSRIAVSTIYRNDIGTAMAQVVKARYEECAAFTCDYDMGAGGYFDQGNEWGKGSIHGADGALEVNTDKPHFGKKSLYVSHSFGAGRNIRGIVPTSDYVFSAWVYVESGKPRFVVEPHVNNSSSPTGTNYDDFVTGMSGWTLVKREISSVRLQNWNIDGVNDYLRIWIGNYDTDPYADMGEFYVDDIRFYPKDALMTTTYYDEDWEKPMLVVDANNNPGKQIDVASFYDKKGVSKYAGNIGFQPSDALKINLFHDEVWQSSAYKDKTVEGKIEYDKFGRPWKWYKFNHNGSDTLIMKKEYHTAGFNYAGQDQCRDCNFNRASDSVALWSLYQSANGTGWTHTWNSAQQITSWYGVTVVNERVSELNLSSNNLTGTMPAALGNLSELTGLQLENNHLTGSIPKELGYLSSLEFLLLNNNTLSGEIPSQLEGMKNLIWLHLQNNSLEGSIPGALGNLIRVTQMYLDHNQLEGLIPQELEYMAALQELKLNNNLLRGSIPRSFGNLTHLALLFLQNNTLVGEVPDELGNLSNLVNFNINTNSFVLLGDSLVKLTQSFTAMDLGNNYLCLQKPALEAWAGASGHDPDWTGTQACNYRTSDSLALVSLYYATVDTNGWTNATNWLTTNPISTWYGVTVSGGRVIQVSLSNNNLSGYLTSAIGDMRELQNLNLSSNSISGMLDFNMYYLPDLRTLQVQNNHISDIGSSTTQVTWLTTLDVGGNNLCLLYPEQENWLNTYDSDWQSTQACNYRESDSLALVSLYRNTGGSLWTNTWTFTNPINTWYGVTVQNNRVTQINLSNNHLKGGLPEDIGNLRELQTFNVSSDSLYGTVPSSLSYIPTLRTLQVQNNFFNGLGDLLVNITWLTAVDLGYNGFCDLAPGLQTWAETNDPDWDETQVCE